MKLRKTVSAFLMGCALCVSAAPASMEPLDSAVAVFVASNIKLAIENALVSFATTGVYCDTAAVKELILQQLALPYDAEAHHLANEKIDAAMSAKAVAESDAFLAAAAARQGAVVTPDGLVVEFVDKGSAEHPTPQSVVSIRYTGSLPDGTVFDSIALGEEPLQATVADLTPGMTEGLMMLGKGGSARFTMPAALGYGTDGIPGVIPPNCALQFDVQLLDFK